MYYSSRKATDTEGFVPVDTSIDTQDSTTQTVLTGLVPNTILEFLPGQHSLDHDITVFNVTSFTMVGSLFSSSSSLGEPTTTITCIGPATLSFYKSQEVTLQAIELVLCGDIHQPAVMVSSVQYFEMVECNVKDSRSVGVLANMSFLTLYSASFHNSLSTGLIVMNGFAKFTGNTTLTRNGNASFINLKSTCFAENSLRCGGGFAAVNSSVNFLGIAFFMGNAAVFGGGVFANYSTLVFQERRFFEENETVRQFPTALHDTIFKANIASRGGGGLLILNSTLHCNSTILFARNAAVGPGGGISASDSSLEFYGNTIILLLNSALHGGGMNVESSDLTCDGTVAFEGNRAVEQGGGISASSSSVSFYGSAAFTTNNAYQGGGMDMQSSDLICDGTAVFDSNRAAKVGVGVSASFGSSVSFYDSAVFTANCLPGWWDVHTGQWYDQLWFYSLYQQHS